MSGRLLPHPNVVARPLEDQLVLVHLDTNRIFTLNRTGIRIWELIVNGNHEHEVEERLLDEYDVPGDDLRTELRRLLDLLRRESLVIEEPEGST